jgi:hypothetical protein
VLKHGAFISAFKAFVKLAGEGRNLFFPTSAELLRIGLGFSADVVDFIPTPVVAKTIVFHHQVFKEPPER